MKRFIPTLILFLTAVNALAFNFNVSGNMEGHMRWTPESDFYGQTRTILSTYLNGNADSRVAYASITLNQSLLDLTQPNPALGWSIYSAYLRVTAPLFFMSKQEIRYSIGNQWVTYSPYAVWINGASGNHSRKGFSLSDLTLGPMAADGFYIWDTTGLPATTHPKIGYGARITLGDNNNNLKYVLAGYKNRTALGEDENGKKKYGLPSEEDLVTGFDAKKQLFPQLSLNGSWFEQKKIQREWQAGAIGITPRTEIEKAPHLKRLIVSWTPFYRGEVVFDYKDFEPGYRPRYADHTPMFYEDSYYGYNSVDRYAGYKGYAIGVTTGARNFLVGINFERFQDRNFDTVPDVEKILTKLEFDLMGYKIDAKAKEEKRTEKNIYGISAIQEVHAVRLEANKRFMMNRNWITPRFLYHIEQKSNNTYSKYIIGQIGIRLGGGFLRGLNIAAGVEKQHIKLFRPFVEGDFKTPGGIDISFRFTSPNQKESTLLDRWDDDFRVFRGFYPSDNFFKASTSGKEKPINFNCVYNDNNMCLLDSSC